MSVPWRPMPNPQVQAFGRAICERLGLDPAMVGETFDCYITGADELSPVTFTVYLPSDELLAMFNAAGPTSAPTTRTAARSGGPESPPERPQ